MTDAPQASLLIPAHNEAGVINRLLTEVVRAVDEGMPLEVLVVCNGCTDDTAAVAGRYPGVRVLESEIPSKHHAIQLGEQALTAFPRVYLDADVELSAEGLAALVSALTDGTHLAAGPRRLLDTSRSAAIVQRYYRVWERLPVSGGLQGRGVIAVSAAGHERLQPWPAAMADDLFIATRFAPDECILVPGCTVVVHAPRTLADLVRRRIRTVWGNRELTELTTPTSTPSNSPANSTGRSSLRAVVRQSRSVASWADLTAFVGVTSVARVMARVRGRSMAGTWLRDESSRSA